MSARWSRAICTRTRPTSSAGRMRASSAWALFADSSRRIPPGVSSASSRCSRHTAWVRSAVSSSRRPQQPQAHQGIVTGHREHAGAIQCRQAGRDRVVFAGRAAMPTRIHPHPGSQLRRHIQHHLPVSDQPLGQRPARPNTSLHRPAALGPPAGEGRQLRITIGSVREPGRLDHRLRHRVQRRGGVARLMRIHRDHHIVTHRIPPGHRGCLQARRAMQLRAAQTSLEPQPHRVSRTGRGAVREPEHPQATAADSRASPPRSAPEDPRSPGSQQRSKQVAESALNVAGGRASAKRHRIALFCAMVMQSAMTSGGGFGCVPSRCEFALPGRGVLDHDRPDPGLQRGCWRLAGALTFTPCRVVKLCGSHGNEVIAGG